jgi:hypothetical protein
MVSEPIRFGRPTSLERPNGRYRGKFWIVPQLMKARYSRQALATNAGCPKETKGRAASRALIGQAQPFDNVALRSLERLGWSLLRDVLAGCVF